MRVLFVIVVCKLARFFGKLFGRGSSLPGKIALKLYPNILAKVKMPKFIIAVTGSNGKTSTVEMIAHILKAANKSFCYNKEGSNQIEGITTFVLGNCTLSGKVKTDIILLETDERFARHTFKYFTPTHLVITNLYRDQLTRNGHPRWVYNCILESLSENQQLILNANDPLVSMFGLVSDNVKWFGVEQISSSYTQFKGIYNDYKYCPNCGSRLIYDYYHYGNVGKFHCSKCGLKTNKMDFVVTNTDFQKGYIEINGSSKISVNIFNMYTMYNVLAAFSVTSIMGIDEKIISKSISNYVSKAGRIINFKISKHRGVLLTSKHENSVSYNQSIDIIHRFPGEVDVVIIVDSISRKYFTGDTSWLWDIDFELLNQKHIRNIVLSGLYCNDLAVRFEYCGINAENIKVIQDIGTAVKFLEKNSVGRIFVITCFSDKNKFLSKVKT